MQNSSAFRLTTRTATIAVAALLALGLSGCSAVQDVLGAADKPVRDAETQEITEGGQGDVFALAVGDCIDAVNGDTVSDVPLVPCSEPHEDEAYFEATLPGETYPGDDEVAAQADAICAEQFPAFAGIAYEDSALDYYPFTPTQDGWDELGDRIVTCMIYEPEVRITGTLAGAAR